MYVKVRLVGSNNREVSVKVSKLTKVKQFKEILHQETHVEPEKQRLFYKGKQLEDGYVLFDYQINLNDVIQLMIKCEAKSEIAETSRKQSKISNEKGKEELKNGHLRSCWKTIHSSLYFKTGDYVDVRSAAFGAWFEGQILDIQAAVLCRCKRKKAGKIHSEEDYDKLEKLQEDIIYVVAFDKYGGETEETNVNNLRPKARKICDISTLKPGMVVLVNYNVNKPKERGLWYDLSITEIRKTDKSVHGDLLITSVSYLKDVTIKFVDEIMKIEKRVSVKKRSKELAMSMTDPTITKISIECWNCQDKDTDLCRTCGCVVCGGKNEPEKQLVCDECDKTYHLKCLRPPLDAIPDEDWFCPNCKLDVSEVVMAGEKLKESKRKSSLTYHNSKSKRDWGRGMACVGRTKECTIVPPNHYGPIPGVEVGTTWLFRVQILQVSSIAKLSKSSKYDYACSMVIGHFQVKYHVLDTGKYGSAIILRGQRIIEHGMAWNIDVLYHPGGNKVSEAGVHRPPVAGIHGRKNDGVYSIVLSGGYEDDLDYGEEFLYTGSGGRDLSGNKRTAEQSFDQQLNGSNRSLATNCDAPVGVDVDIDGAEAEDWRKGKPVRVVRSHKLKVHSEYAPEKGCRYDGIYKVVKYWREKGKSGFYVWRYMLRRDDEVPAPWTKEGMKRIESLGLQLIYPDGYLEAMGLDKKEIVPKKRQKTDLPEKETKKRPKVMPFQLSPDLKKLVNEDCNKNLWNECKAVLPRGKLAFLSKVNEVFTCACCCELVFQPVTTKCLHNMCMKCLQRSISAEVKTCPYCRSELDLKGELEVNYVLSSILRILFLGYEKGR